MATALLTLIGKPGCHLCDDARELVDSVVLKLADNPAAPAIVLEERSILDDAELNELYVEDIPVLLINGKVHNYWRIDPLRLRSALLAVQ
ncbi:MULTISPECIES: glutaredoxin family protein [Cryobacterium]|uniref:Glutaredoxin family protein n=1 Tax=Cryobacterium mannosilyticum TaxID=1259190 RepID=A0A4R8W9P9_9MICO|nr:MULTISPECIES: glutaredoxin family protein [Cryobacterium]TFB95019.1 glutaredoxin family protein [Cryobacterium sp. HLT2-28]TFC03600.1 glutaredoxin family protein [Cryobacterium mannosilyticum]